MSRLAYFFRETTISLRRNLLMTLAGIMTVAVSLFLFGGVMLLSRLVDHGTEQWKHDVRFEVFMKVDATKNQIDEISKQLSSLESANQVKTFTFLNHDDALKVFRHIFADQPVLLQNIKAQDLPTSFRVTPVTAELTAHLVDQFRGRSGVDTVNSAPKAVKNMLDATRVIRYAFFGLSAALLASSLFLIVNTIRLATFARRREIEVMKLVGASNWFVRVPFMAEGFVQGAAGAGIAFGLVYVLKIILSNLVHHTTEQTLISHWFLTRGDAIGIGVVVLIIGAFIGLAGSAIGLRRFLEV